MLYHISYIIIFQAIEYKMADFAIGKHYHHLCKKNLPNANIRTQTIVVNKKLIFKPEICL